MKFSINTKHRGSYKYHLQQPNGRGGYETLYKIDNWIPNLITNFGFDRMVTVSFSGTGLWRQYFGVGDGPGVPAVTDTTLFNQVAIGNSTGGTGQVVNAFIDGTTDEYVYERTITRQLTFATAANLTNFGFTDTNGPAGYNILNQFKDGGGTPITISVPGGGTLLTMTHKHTVRAPFLQTTVTQDVVFKDLLGTVLSTVPTTAEATLFSSNGSLDHINLVKLIDPQKADENASSRHWGRFNTNVGVPLDANSAVLTFTETFNTATTAANVTQDTYVAGSKQLFAHYNVPAALFDGTWYGIAIQSNASSKRSGFKAILNVGDEFVNTATQAVTATIHLTWGP